jgi:trehalose 6-phosphate synthase/phosphatase
MGINYEMYRDGPLLPEAVSFAEELRKLVGDNKIILSVDRLDYSKGILIRLKSYAGFLENNPEYRGRVKLIMVVVPSRDNVEKYAALKENIDKMVGAINGSYAAVGWTPVHYFYRSFAFPQLSALYHIADIALVTPLRDGMNLVAKEYIAAKRDRPGVIILSEMAGASVELSEAIIVNPADAKQIENALLEALAIPEEEQVESLRAMQRVLARQDVYQWARDYFSALMNAKKRNEFMRGKVLEGENLVFLQDVYKKSEKRLLIFDYDGTLTPLVKKPERAFPGPSLTEILATLARDSRNKVVVCSGRDKETLEKWLGGLAVDLAAEHGAFYKEDGVWHDTFQPAAWDEDLLGIFERITDKTPHSAIERKKTALVWHYREVDPWLSDLRVTQLVDALISPCSRLGLQIMRGNKIVEVKNAAFNKGTEVKRLVQKGDFDFFLALGDDTTDEDMFAALPPGAVTVNVGQVSDQAVFFLPDQSQVLPLLRALGGGDGPARPV